MGSSGDHHRLPAAAAREPMRLQLPRVRKGDGLLLRRWNLAIFQAFSLVWGPFFFASTAPSPSRLALHLLDTASLCATAHVGLLCCIMFHDSFSVLVTLLPRVSVVSLLCAAVGPQR